MFKSRIGMKPGVYSPVTGQAVVVQTTCVDDDHVDIVKRKYKEDSSKRYPLHKMDMPRRVESHLLAIRKKKGRSKYIKGSGTDLKIITMINGCEMGRDKAQDWEAVGIVQTPVNPVRRRVSPNVNLPQLTFCAIG